MATLTISTTRDYSGQILFNIGTLDFANGRGTTATATFAGSQFNNLNLSKSLSVDGSGGVNVVAVLADYRGFDASGWSYTGWSLSDRLVVTGSNTAETMIGSSQRDRIVGNGGSDTIRGLDGADIIEGGPGGDRLDGGLAADTLSYEGSLQSVRVDLGNGTAFGGDATGDDFTAFEHLTGSHFGDELAGNGGFNRITGGAGSDTLRGRGGPDIFVFNDVADSLPGLAADVIADFSRADHDRIRLAAIDAGTSAGNGAFAFLGSDPFDGKAGVRVVAAGNRTIVQADANGDRIADLEIILVGSHRLTADDFIL